jgi:peptidoglycan/xylan/chitin deacetylase (PgdA/CDA1 family)
MTLRTAAALLLVLLACERTNRPVAPPPQALTKNPSVGVWTWHPLGGLAVVEGEVIEPTELILEGPSIREHRYAELGPVRWEFFRPPDGEVAVLRTQEGRELARFQFSLTRPPTQPALPALLQARQSAPPAKVLPEAPAPKTFTEARLRNLPVTPLSPRKPSVLPSVSQAPTQAPHRASGAAPLLLETELPRAAKPAPPRASIATPILPEPLLPRPLKPTPAVPAAHPSIGATAAWPGMGEALNLTRGPGGHKRLLLSFDGGSSAEVATEVLDLLKTRGVHTTLFLTGAFIQRFPTLVKRMAAEGHELGNHTMNHPHFAPGMKRDPQWTRERIQRELLDADAALVRLLGRPMDPFWRAPYGEHTAEIRRWAEELGYRHVGWSEGADTLDWATPKDRRLYRSGEAIVSRLQQRLGRDGDGLIVLMHLGSGREEGDRPTDGLGAFMDRARNEGWTFVSAGSFLNDLGKPTWDSQQRIVLVKGSQSR